MEKTKNAIFGVRSDFMAPVDIIIPFHGQYERVTKLIDSIYRLTRTNYFNICLVDDASTNRVYIDTVAKNSEKSASKRGVANNLKTIRCESRKGFGGALKVGYENTVNPYVCLMHSDCLIEDANWLRAMGESLLKLKSSGVRMVSAVTDNIAGGHPAQEGSRFVKDHDDVILEDLHLSLYCVLAHRELFVRCNGFIKEYPVGMFEDQEFAHRMRYFGFKQAVCKKSWVAHEGYATIGPLLKLEPDLQKVIEEDNRERYLQDIKNLSEAANSGVISTK